MIDKDKVTAAIAEMTKNPDWKDVLMNAPGAANLRIALAFYASKNLDTMTSQEKDEYREFRENLESQLTAEELQYLTDQFGRMGVDAAKQHYGELLAKKQQQGQSQNGATAGQPQNPQQYQHPAPQQGQQQGQEG